MYKMRHTDKVPGDMSRLEFTRKVRRAIIDRAAGKCEACGAILKKGGGEVDHILPAALGGSAEAANGRLICGVCHKAKTAVDVRRIRKADAQRDRATGAIVAKQKIRSAGFLKRAPRVQKPKLAPRALYQIGRLLPAGTGDTE